MVHELVLVALPRAEVVWGERTAADRAILRSIPGPASGFHWLDEVRVIPARLAEVAFGDVAYPVFPGPDIVDRSGIPTLLGRIACAEGDDLTALVDELELQGVRCEDWSTNGNGNHRRGHPPEDPGALPAHGVAIAGTPEDAEAALKIWVDEAPDDRVLLELGEAP
ncbi:MAG TPA: hypothetical protein VK646_02780 [Actinomycetota bacterium]|nr:hypothetical protein [Actinomycetota bacterium]